MYPPGEFFDYHRPYCWWGYHWNPPVPLSIVQIIQAGSLDAPLAALLWLMLERRASLVVAAKPPLAGKSTTLTALLDFLPPETERIYLRGLSESFDFVGQTPPERAYLLCNEISPDLPTYMWGRKAAMVFQLMGQGYPMASTMHAHSVEKVIDILGTSLGIPHSLVAHLNLVLCLEMAWDRGQTSRRVHSLHLLEPEGDHGISVAPLAQRTPDGLCHQPEAALTYLEEAGLARQAAQAELERRRGFLESLVRQGVSGIAQVRRAISGYSPGFTGRGGLGG